MNLALYIAKRYLFSAKSKNAVNSITAISVIGVAIGTLALIVVLSVFNGFESLIKSMYASVHSDFEITAKEGKRFAVDSIDLAAISAVAPWKHALGVYEEKVLLKVEDREQVAKIMGLEDYALTEDSLPIEKGIFKGMSFRTDTSYSWAIIGQPLSYTLSASPFQDVIKAFIPNPKANVNSLSHSAFIEKEFGLSGVYTLQAEFDAAYMVTRLEPVQEFFNKKGKLTSLQLQLPEGLDGEDFESAIRAQLGSAFTLKNRYQQQEFLYKVLQTEKWAIFFILSFILLIATFNIVASVVMIVLEKRKDISGLWAMGMPKRDLQKIFFYEGFLISSVGGGLGLALGIVLCFLQQEFGIIQLGAQGSFIIDAYPVELQLADILLTTVTVLGIGTLVTYIPVAILKKRILKY